MVETLGNVLKLKIVIFILHFMYEKWQCLNWRNIIRIKCPNTQIAVQSRTHSMIVFCKTIFAVKHDCWLSLTTSLFIESKHFVVRQPITQSTMWRLFRLCQERVRWLKPREVKNQGSTHHSTSVQNMKEYKRYSQVHKRNFFC